MLDFEEIEEGIGRVRIMPAERLQTELPMHEDNCISCFEEVFSRGSTSRS